MPEERPTAKQSILFVTQLIILFTGTVAGAVISDPIDKFYNLLIMPGVGGLGFIAFRKKWYYVPCGPGNHLSVADSCRVHAGWV